MSIWGRKVSARTVAATAALMVLVAGLLPVRTKAPARELTLVARDMAFYLEDDPETANPAIEAKPGETLRVVLRNRDRGLTHDFAVPAAGAGQEGRPLAAPVDHQVGPAHVAGERRREEQAGPGDVTGEQVVATWMEAASWAGPREGGSRVLFVLWRTGETLTPVERQAEVQRGRLRAVLGLLEIPGRFSLTGIVGDVSCRRQLARSELPGKDCSPSRSSPSASLSRSSALGIRPCRYRSRA